MALSRYENQFFGAVGCREHCGIFFWSLFTTHQIDSEHEIGSLEVGKLADMVILDQDPRKVPVDAIKSIRVLETWMDGKRVFEA